MIWRGWENYNPIERFRSVEAEAIKPLINAAVGAQKLKNMLRDWEDGTIDLLDEAEATALIDDINANAELVYHLAKIAQNIQISNKVSNVVSLIARLSNHLLTLFFSLIYTSCWWLFDELIRLVKSSTKLKVFGIKWIQFSLLSNKSHFFQFRVVIFFSKSITNQQNQSIKYYNAPEFSHTVLCVFSWAMMGNLAQVQKIHQQPKTDFFFLWPSFFSFNVVLEFFQLETRLVVPVREDVEWLNGVVPREVEIGLGYIPKPLVLVSLPTS